MLVIGTLLVTALRFAWPAPAEARVELTDERTVGDESRTIVMTMRLRVEPEAATGHVVVRFSDAKLISIDGGSPGDTDPAPTLRDVGRLMTRATPTMVVDQGGRYLETRDLDKLTRDVLSAAGFPTMPMGDETFSRVLNDVAAQDWNAWVGAWIGNELAVGESAEAERNMRLGGGSVPVHLTRRGLTPSVSEGRTRLDATAIYPSEAVRKYTQGFLIDMARESQELGDDDPVASVRFAESARYSPLTDTLTVELETATMRPLFAERTRSFSAMKGKHVVEGRERRTHRFTWVAN
jgi:hypothetical protein